jgi:hypothetical protein
MQDKTSQEELALLRIMNAHWDISDAQSYLSPASASL